MIIILSEPKLNGQKIVMNYENRENTKLVEKEL